MTPDQLRLYTVILVCFLVVGAGLLGIAVTMISSRISRDEEWSRSAGEAVMRAEARKEGRGW